MNVATAVAPEATSTTNENVLPWKLVTHTRPDTDAWVCLWAAVTFVVRNDPYKICFIPAGTSLQADEVVGNRVIQMDTGKGEMDQHGKELTRASSFQLFCKKFGLENDPALKSIIELTVSTDNVEDVNRTSVHYVLKGLAYYYKDDATNEIDWEAARIAAFMCLDIIYNQAIEREKNRAAYAKHKEVRTLANGLKVANLWFRPGTRDAAFEDGNDVVLYLARRGEKFYPIIQCNRKCPVLLDRVIFGLRKAEAKVRNVKTSGADLWAIGSNPLFGAWFFHDSHKMIACGTNGHELTKPDEFTKLGPKAIMDIVCRELNEVIPPK